MYAHAEAHGRCRPSYIPRKIDLSFRIVFPILYSPWLSFGYGLGLDQFERTGATRQGRKRSVIRSRPVDKPRRYLTIEYQCYRKPRIDNPIMETCARCHNLGGSRKKGQQNKLGQVERGLWATFPLGWQHRIAMRPELWLQIRYKHKPFWWVLIAPITTTPQHIVDGLVNIPRDRP